MILMIAIVCNFANRLQFFKFFISSFLRLSLSNDKAVWFCNNFFVIYQRFFKLMVFKTLKISWFKKR